MSSEFYTSLNVIGTREECENVLELLKYYTEDCYKQYKKEHDCWYLRGKISEDFSEHIVISGEKCRINLGLGGPYGIMNGPIGDEIDLFERIADKAPGCIISGYISGDDPGARMTMTAQTKDGLLYLKSTYKPFDDWYDDDEDEIEDNDEDTESWDTAYDPVAHEYKDVIHIEEGGGVKIQISVFGSSGKEYKLCLQSESVKHPLNIMLWPEELVTARNITRLFDMIINSLRGKGAEEKKEEVAAFAETVINELNSGMPERIVLSRVRNHSPSLYFGWLRTSYFSGMKKFAKKVCTCAERNKEKNLTEFKKCVDSYKPWFPGTEYDGWPDFCQYHVINEGDGCLSFRRSNTEPVVRFEWRGIASSLEKFADYLCSKEVPKEYAEEIISIDYTKRSIDFNCLYMPGGPELK